MENFKNSKRVGYIVLALVLGVIIMIALEGCAPPPDPGYTRENNDQENGVGMVFTDKIGGVWNYNEVLVDEYRTADGTNCIVMITARGFDFECNW